MAYGLTIVEKNQIEYEAKRTVWLRNKWAWPPRKRTEYELAQIRAQLRQVRGRGRKKQ